MTDQPTICANCKHMGRGRGVDERPAEPGFPPRGPRPSSYNDDPICLRHPRGREPVDPVSGYGGHKRALYCADVNKGNCPDYERGVNEDNAGTVVFGVAMLATIGVLATFFILLAMGSIR